MIGTGDYGAGWSEEVEGSSDTRRPTIPGHFLHLLGNDPWVAATYHNPGLRDAARRLARDAGGAAAQLLVIPSAHGPTALADIIQWTREIGRELPALTLTVATATADDTGLYRRAGLNAVWCNHNALLDERIYTPDPVAEKVFDAVYVARFLPIKRHELAVAIPRLAVISAPWEVDDAYARACIAAFQDLRFVNYRPGGGINNLPAGEVRQLINASRCGLALSPYEGPMYASAEYLLCGIPEVTTPSEGGRDLFFHPDYVETVAPDPAAVAEGVARLIQRAPDPMTIRQRTLELMMPHRIRLLMWLSGLAGENLFQAAGPSLWPPAFKDKLMTWWED